jgi:hypothetical protein
MVKALLIVLAATSVAHAHPVLVDRDPPPPTIIVAPPPPPPPAEKLHTRLGWRIGVGQLPIGRLDVIAVGLVQLTGDIEIADRTRTFAEYEFLMLSPNRTMSGPQDGIGHRGSLGLMRELLGKRTSNGVAHFNVSAEIGGGAALLSGAIAERVIPHGLAGLRFGFSLHVDHDHKREPSFGFELLLRATVVPEGAGFGFGIGFVWGE